MAGRKFESFKFYYCKRCDNIVPKGKLNKCSCPYCNNKKLVPVWE